MNIVTAENLQDLFGFWSRLALALGFAGALLSHCSGKLATASAVANKPKVVQLLPWLMWIAGFFIGCVVLPMSMAHSGRLPFDSVVELSYDKYFAALIDFAFGLVFTFDALRFQTLRRNPATWVCLLLYFATALYSINGAIKD